VRRLTLFLLLMTVVAGTVSAQRRHRTSKPNCSKGVSCGGTCIPAGRQCHVDDGSSSSNSHSSTGQVNPFGSGTQAQPVPEPAVQDTDAAPTTASFLPGVQRDDRDRIKRSEAAKKSFMKMTGHLNGWSGHVIDHVVPLACGGADDPINMQWQTVEEGKAKDKVEREGCEPKR